MVDRLEKFRLACERLKYIREKLLKLSRADVYNKYGISVDTLAAWENGKTQLTEKGIHRCIRMYAAENLIVSREWILSGEGLDPKFSFDLARYFKTTSEENHSEKEEKDILLLLRELEYFRSLASNSITILISSDDMLPLYSIGDYVGGRFIYEIESCIGKDCIIQTDDEAIYVRRVSIGNTKSRYNLVCLNPAWNGNPEPVIFNASVKCAAPIIWHRRPLNT